MKKPAPLLTGEALTEFCRQMAMFLKAGYSLEESLQLLAEDMPALEGLAGQLSRTGDLAAAMETAGLPDYFLKMLRLGQETGRLEEVFSALAEHHERELAVRRSLRDAVRYPAVMLLTVLLILGLTVTKILPLFEQAFAQLGASLTGFSRVLLELGRSLRGAVWLLPALALLALGAGLLLKRRRTFPGKVGRTLALSRLTGALALGLSSGLSTHYALELAMELSPDPRLLQKLRDVRAQLDRGEDLAQALRSAGILSGRAGRLLLVGRRTGALDGALSQIAADLREEADRSLEAMIAGIEPVAVVVLSVFTAVLLVSILVPMLSLLSAV